MQHLVPTNAQETPYLHGVSGVSGTDLWVTGATGATGATGLGILRYHSHGDECARPIPDVMAEHPGMDGFCYFSDAGSNKLAEGGAAM